MEKIITNVVETTPSTITNVFEVTNKMGIHARPAAMIVRITNKYYNTEVWVEKDEERVNGKSIMGLMMLAAGYKTQLKFIIKGESTQKLLQEITELFNRKFEEG